MGEENLESYNQLTCDHLPPLARGMYLETLGVGIWEHLLQENWNIVNKFYSLIFQDFCKSHSYCLIFSFQYDQSMIHMIAVNYI